MLQQYKSITGCIRRVFSLHRSSCTSLAAVSFTAQLRPAQSYSTLLKTQKHLPISFPHNTKPLLHTNLHHLMQQQALNTATPRFTKAVDLLASLPPPLSAANPHLDTWQDIQQYLQELQQKALKPLVIVLDDDPTGCQTVYNVNVLLEYNIPALIQQLANCKEPPSDGKFDPSLFYILTNTRALPKEQAVEVLQEVLHNIQIALKEVFGNQIPPLHIVSRGDSTLRGHFQAEIETIAKHHPQQISFDGVIICPVFFDGGRITAHDVHFIQEPATSIIPNSSGLKPTRAVTTQTKVTPCGESPFAKDPHFGFQSSNLVDYIHEKCGQDLAHNIVSITLEDIRIGGIESIKTKLRSAKDLTYIIVNAVDEDDLNRFTLALLQVEQEGKQFMARTAASYVASRCGLKPRPLLEYSDLLASSSSHDAQQAAVDKQSKGGIIVVGSYVPKTTAQLSHLLQHMDIEAIELPVATLIESRRKSKNFDFDSYKVVDELILSIVTKISNLLAQDKHVVLYTSREFYPNATIAETAFVSHSLTEIISRIKYHPTTGTESIQPAYIVSKGGITSHEVAQFSLGIESAVVLGQIEAGIPVWKASISEDEGQPQVQEQSTLTEQVERSVIPSSDMIYIVFPGNVGDDTMLSKVAMKLGVAAKEATNSPPPPSSSGSTKKMYKATSEQMLQTLHQAKVDRRAIAAFNIYNLEGAKAVVEAAEACNSPIIIQIHPAPLQYGQEPLLRMLQSFQKHAKVPVYLHLDHASREEDIEYALSLGLFDSIMIDGSHREFEENLMWTKKMAALAHGEGVLVEAELGKLAGEEDGLSVELKDMKMTDPIKAVRFVQETKVELLAVTIGNVHGKYAMNPPQLDFDRLQQIRRNLQAEQCHPHLVLHGASGLPSNLIQQCIQHEVVKFNVNTDLRTSALDFMKKELTSNPKTDILDLMKGSTKVMKDVAVEKINLFRPLGKPS